MLSVLLVCLYMFVCKQHYSTSYERIIMRFYGRVQGGTMIQEHCPVVTNSHQITEVKQRRARLVLGWVTSA